MGICCKKNKEVSKILRVSDSMINRWWSRWLQKMIWDLYLAKEKDGVKFNAEFSSDAGIKSHRPAVKIPRSKFFYWNSFFNFFNLTFFFRACPWREERASWNLYRWCGRMNWDIADDNAPGNILLIAAWRSRTDAGGTWTATVPRFEGDRYHGIVIPTATNTVSWIVTPEQRKWSKSDRKSLSSHFADLSPVKHVWDEFGCRIQDNYTIHPNFWKNCSKKINGNEMHQASLDNLCDSLSKKLEPNIRSRYSFEPKFFMKYKFLHFS